MLALWQFGVAPNDDEQTLTDTLVRQLEAEYEQLLDNGFEAFPIQPRPSNYKGHFPQHPVTNLLVRLRDYRDAVLAFLHHPASPV